MWKLIYNFFPNNLLLQIDKIENVISFDKIIKIYK